MIPTNYRNVSAKGLELIKAFEGFSPVKYVCPAGYPTIGYGHVITSGENLGKITEEEAEYLLYQDLEKSEKAVLRNIRVPLSDGQFDALVSFVFNLGAGSLQRSSLRQKINREDHQSAAEEFLRWVWCSGKRSSGLIRRRRAEAALYLS